MSHTDGGGGGDGDTDTDTDWIGETFTSDAGWDHLERLVDVGNRMAGQDGERAGLEATRDALDAAGARDARIEEFEIQGWVRGDSAVRIGDTQHDCIALPRSPDGVAEGELVDVGYGLPDEFAEADLDGKIAVVSSAVPDWFDRYIHRREKYYAAVRAGAAGFVYRNHVEGCLPPTGSVGTGDDPIGDMPAVGVSAEVGARLVRRFAGEGDVAEVRVDCETPDARSGNVVADVGPDTEEAVWLTSHVDAHDIAEGARDNGAGTATVVEVARALASRADDLDRRVRCVCFGSEEVGLLGSERAAANADLDRIAAVVNVDSNAGGRTLELTTHGFDELGAAAEAVSDRFDHPIEVVPEQMPHSDHWPFVERGVPGYMVTSETEGRGRGWGHTFADTLDKIESRTLREQSILLIQLVVDLADADAEIPRRDPDEIAAALEAEDKAEGMKLIGDWPF